MTAPLDLRSDTVTKPSDRMRRAMAEAEVGDDWYGDDPTVNRLQDRASELTGKDAALYVPTGTMANQIALHIFCRPGHYVAAGAHSHVAGTEVASSAVLSGIAFHRIEAQDRGQLTAEVVSAALEPDPYDVDVIDLVCIENTAQVGGGTVLAVEELRSIRKIVADRDLPLYMDGARVFNACAAAGVEVDAYAGEVDALMFCLSKGLGAPIGSILCGPAGFIREARRMKFTFGGGWRQAGIVAAAGLIALDEGRERLHEDHANAQRLAQGVAEVLPGSIDPDAVETNILFVDVSRAGWDAWEVLGWLRAEGVLATMVGGKVRMLTHVGIAAGDVERAVEAWRRVAEAHPALGASPS
jgi:threonine aldolase